MLPQCISSSGSQVKQQLAFQRLASVNSLLRQVLTEVFSGSRRTDGKLGISGCESNNTISSSVLIA